MPKMPEFPPLPPGLDEAMVLTGHRTVSYGNGCPDFDRIYDKLAARLYVSREFVKRLTLMIGYGGKVDPWIKHLVETEIEIIMNEPQPAKIKHREVFIERQLQASGAHRYICHTGILKFLPNLYDTQEQAIAAVDAKLDGAKHG